MDLYSITFGADISNRYSSRQTNTFWRTQSILSDTTQAATAAGPGRQAPNERLLEQIITKLDDDKAEEIITIDMAGKSSMCDFMVIASGRSQRQVAAIAEHLRELLKPQMAEGPSIEGLPEGDWVLVDAGDVIVHLFRPEVRAYYRLESMWGLETPSMPTTAALVDDTTSVSTEGD
mgnify:CR=1 FL=1|jgi:ribosome-associated protein